MPKTTKLPRGAKRAVMNLVRDAQASLADGRSDNTQISMINYGLPETKEVIEEIVSNAAINGLNASAVGFLGYVRFTPKAKT